VARDLPRPQADRRRLGPWARAILRATIVCGLGFVWTWFIWFKTARSFPVMQEAILAVERAFIVVPITGSLAWAFRSGVFILVPLTIILAIVRHPAALGLGRVQPGGWRFVALGLAVASPFCIWLGMRPGMQAYYSHMFGDGGWKPLLANALVIVVEHAWIQGVILSLALPRGAAPSHGVAPLSRRGALAFIGLGFPTGLPRDERSVWQWLGIPAIATPSLILQALVFGAVHVGKELDEVIAAFPGGLGLGMLTYRTGAVWPSVTLHLSTGAMIVGTILLTR
jgi:hypothetical protein